MKIINGSTYCNRCAQLSCIGDDGLCEDCRELIALREKVLMKQSRIAELEAEVKRLREALENIKCGIIVRDPANTILKRVNDALNELAASGKHKGGKDGTDIFTQQKGT